MTDRAQELAQRLFGMTGQSPNNGNPGTVYNTSPTKQPTEPQPGLGGRRAPRIRKDMMGYDSDPVIGEFIRMLQERMGGGAGQPIGNYGYAPDGMAGGVFRGGQNPTLGRYVPPTIRSMGGGSGQPAGVPIWNESSGGYTYNLPNHYGPNDSYTQFGQFGQPGAPAPLPQFSAAGPGMGGMAQRPMEIGLPVGGPGGSGGQMGRGPRGGVSPDMMQQFLAFLQANGGG